MADPFLACLDDGLGSSSIGAEHWLCGLLPSVDDPVCASAIANLPEISESDWWRGIDIDLNPSPTAHLSASHLSAKPAAAAVQHQQYRDPQQQQSQLAYGVGHLQEQPTCWPVQPGAAGLAMQQPPPQLSRFTAIMQQASQLAGPPLKLEELGQMGRTIGPGQVLHNPGCWAPQQQHVPTAVADTTGLIPAAHSTNLQQYQQRAAAPGPTVVVTTELGAATSATITHHPSPPSPGAASGVAASSPAAVPMAGVQGTTARTRASRSRHTGAGGGSPVPPAAAEAADEASTGQQGKNAALAKLTVMQRYHLKRKLNMQRMEKEVAAKLEQLSILKQENELLQSRARVLEMLLADIDLLATLLPPGGGGTHAKEWFAVLTGCMMSSVTSDTRGGQGSGQQQPKLHPMLGVVRQAMALDASNWTLAEVVCRWNGFIHQVHPLLQQLDMVAKTTAAAARRRPPAKVAGGGISSRLLGSGAGPGALQLSTPAADGGGASTGPMGRSRRAAAVAAVTKISALTQELEGTGADGVQQGLLPAVGMEGTPQGSSRAGSASSSSSSGTFNMAGGSAAAGAGISISISPEAAIQQQLAQAVHEVKVWLWAVLLQNSKLTYQLTTADLQGQGRTPPPPGDPFWISVAQAVGLSRQQLLDCATCLETVGKCRAGVRAEREKLQVALQQPGSASESSSVAAIMQRMHVQREVLGAMCANVQREVVVRNMVGLFCAQVLTPVQTARLAVAAAPWFSNSWYLFRAAAQLVEEGGPRGPGSRGNSTR